MRIKRSQTSKVLYIWKVYLIGIFHLFVILPLFVTGASGSIPVDFLN